MAVTSAAESTPALPDYLASPNAVFADEDVQWRYGRAPDYSKTRKVWEEGRKSDHVTGSLPQLVENLVKNWEVEASFKPRLQDWRTIDPENYSFAMSGGPPQSAEHMLKVGTYNAIIEPNEYYDPTNSDFASSHKTFKRMMPTFAWEVVEVYSGPPVVVFKWRHWGTMKNDYVGFNNKGEKVTAKAHGGPIEIFGTTVAKVDDKVRLQAVDTYMDSLSMFRQIAPYGIVNKEPMNKKADKAEALDSGPGHNGVKTAEEYNSIEAASNVDQAAGADIPKHISNNTGVAADAPIEQIGACPFMARNELSPHITLPDGHPDVPNTNGMNGSTGVHDASKDVNGRSGTDLCDTSETPTQPDFPVANGHGTDTAMEDQQSTVTPSPEHGSGSNGTVHPDSPATPTQSMFNHSAGGRVSTSGSDVSSDWSMVDAPQSQAELSTPDKTDGAQEGATHLASMNGNGDVSAVEQAPPHDIDMVNNRQPPKRAAVDNIPRSNYSSEVTGNVEDVVKAARSDGYVDESVMTGTYDAVDKHLESSADQVHPHLKTMEETVKPNPGEAVAVAGNTEETRQTYEEMSEIKPEEKELIMNGD